MSELQIPANYIIRDALAPDAAGIARVHVDSWRSTYAGIMPDDILKGLSYSQREQMWAERIQDRAEEQPLLVAEISDEVVGFVGAGPERSGKPEYTGEIYAIYLLKEVQRQGIGKALFLAAADRLAALGHSSLLVWVAAENPSRGFYAALGGVEIDEKEENFWGKLVREVAYGWPSLDLLKR